MILIVTSTEDAASMNIKERLLELGEWKDVGIFGFCPQPAVDAAPSAEDTAPQPILARGSLRMVQISIGHLWADAIDAKFAAASGSAPSLVVFASRHRSQTGKATLTVHPIGNYGAADFGGTAGTLVPSAPREMTYALARLKHHGAGLPYEISYEATHHGPLLSTPTFYIEIGSDESRWPDPSAAKAIAQTILELDGYRREEGAGAPASLPSIAVGVGGGHYAPRHTDAALAGLASFGHIVPNHALDAEPEKRIQMALDATPGAKAVYLHRKSMKKPLVRTLEGWCAERGIAVLRGAGKSDG
jgi:D-tyrosyl-tRNA(Tyr) deacylase